LVAYLDDALGSADSAPKTCWIAHVREKWRSGIERHRGPQIPEPVTVLAPAHHPESSFTASLSDHPYQLPEVQNGSLFLSDNIVW